VYFGDLLLKVFKCGCNHSSNSLLEIKKTIAIGSMLKIGISSLGK